MEKMPHMKKLPLAGSLLVALALIGAGCPLTQKAEEKVAEEAVEAMIENSVEDDGGSGDVEIEDDSFTFTDNETGETFSFGEGADLPEEFPNDVPLYQPSTVLASSSSNNNQDFTVSLQTSDDFDTVADFYDDEIESEGWEVDDNASFSGDGQTVTITANKDGRRLSVVVFQFETEEVSVTITVEGADSGSEE
jgi:hypothetical protein